MIRLFVLFGLLLVSCGAVGPAPARETPAGSGWGAEFLTALPPAGSAVVAAAPPEAPPATAAAAQQPTPAAPAPVPGLQPSAPPPVAATSDRLPTLTMGASGAAAPASTAVPPTQPAGATPAPVTTPSGSPLTPIAAVGIGETHTIAGQISAVYSFAAGFKLTVMDDSGSITLLLWHDVYDDCWDAPQLAVGAWVRASGVVGDYEGERQLTPDWGGDVQVVTAAPAPVLTPLGALADWLDRYVVVQGAVTSAAQYDYGWQIQLSDDSGGITLFLWPNVAERVPAAAALLTPGTVVRAAGWVQLYRSNRQLVPALPHAVTVVSAAD